MLGVSPKFILEKAKFLLHKNLFEENLNKLEPEQQNWARPILETFAKDIRQVMVKQQGNLFSTEHYFQILSQFARELSELFDNPSDVTFMTLSQKCKEFRESLVAVLKKPQSSVGSHG